MHDFRHVALEVDERGLRPSRTLGRLSETLAGPAREPRGALGETCCGSHQPVAAPVVAN